MNFFLALSMMLSSLLAVEAFRQRKLKQATMAIGIMLVFTVFSIT